MINGSTKTITTTSHNGNDEMQLELVVVSKCNLQMGVVTIKHNGSGNTVFLSGATNGVRNTERTFGEEQITFNDITLNHMMKMLICRRT